MTELAPLEPATLPSGIRSRFIEDINGLRMHLLEAGDPNRPCVLLLHGFPELAYSWRKVMLPLAHAGYHVIAPDQRGYGRTTGWSDDYDGSLAPFRLLNLMRWDCWRRLATPRRRPWSGMISVHPSPLGAHWCGPMYSVPSR
jgi:pimeloyl-ACP methyl ester carboxylesterase